MTQSSVGKSSKNEDEEAMEEENEEETKPPGVIQGYTVYGTSDEGVKHTPDFVNIIALDEKRENFIEKVMQCDYIIYNIKDDCKAIDEALWILEKLHDNLDKFATQKQFILISSVLTWAKSSLPDPNDPEMPFTDDDYLRRKAHSSYKEHILAEKSVIQQGKTVSNA
ncbi:unnamed protein product [Trichobilharzia regenti]|nr:unnamed protein product [Trichobilharzia regenti]